MVNVKLSKREMLDLELAIDLATEDLDGKVGMCDTDEQRLACEATGQRLTALYKKLRSAAQKAGW